MTEIRIALVGFGNVGRALVRLLAQKQELLRSDYGFSTLVTGIATGHHGMAINENGINIDEALRLSQNGQDLTPLSAIPVPSSIMEFIRAVPADVLFENSPVNHHTGQPATDHLRAALEQGMHAITANKGPVVHAYDALTRLAQEKGSAFSL